MIAKKTIPSRATLPVIALDPRAIPSARACMLNPIVVFDSPVGLSGLRMFPEEEERSSRDVEGSGASGICDAP